MRVWLVQDGYDYDDAGESPGVYASEESAVARARELMIVTSSGARHHPDGKFEHSTDGERQEWRNNGWSVVVWPEEVLP